ncbi:MAG: hypothetical protein ACI4EA_12740 [Candidatus Ornithomonoglobus sp.]
MKNDNDLFFTCSLIEYIGRKQKQKRGDVVRMLGEKTIKRIYKYADVLHCEPIAKVADEFINLCNIPEGNYDNISKCRYEVPDYWSIGKVYERLIEDVMEDDTVNTLFEVYSSWISDSISNYNSDFFYQPRDYIRECYFAGDVL